MAITKILGNVLYRRSVAAAAFVLALAVGPLTAQTSPFEGGWTLDSGKSAIRFQSVKNTKVVESSEFATFTGEIAEDGTATVRVLLDSVDTKIDLRNVRMRFLFFETFQYPEAVVTTRIDPTLVSDLPNVMRKTVPLTFTLDLHGVTQEWTTDATITLLTEDQVVVSTGTPFSLPLTSHNLENGVRKLEEAAGVEIVPSATVSYDFVFARNRASVAPAAAEAPAATAPAAQAAQVTPAAPAAPATAATQPERPTSAALETAGNFGLEACIGRFEILSRTDNIVFRSGWSELEPSSFFLLDSIADIVRRCPDLRIEVGGHTDDVGSDAANLRLSQRRAASVVNYLIGKGVDPNQITSAGYGEARPLVANTSPENRRRNRRIEFTAIRG